MRPARDARSFLHHHPLLPLSCCTARCYCPDPRGGVYWRPRCVDCELREAEAKENCIKRTGERWAWFSAARDMDDERGERLGTLGYLPCEIRQEIIKLVILHDRLGYPPCETVTELYPEHKTYTFSYVDDWPDSHSLRLASPTMRIEFEHCYLTNTTFSFAKPRDLEAFLDKLSIYQQSLLRNFILKMYPLWRNERSVNGWVAVCARLPPNLLSIQFRMFPWVGIAMEAGGEWFIRARASCGFQPAIGLLDILGKRARRCAARAKIGLSGPYLEPRCDDPSGEEWVRVLHDIEPWSEDWMKWWEESTKVVLDDGEGAIEMA